MPAIEMQKIHLPGNITFSQKVDFLLLIEQFLHLVDEGLSLVVLLAVVVAVELAEQLALLFGQAARRFHAHLENQIALIVRPKLLDALAADAELGVLCNVSDLLQFYCNYGKNESERK